ncbi:hypothetical protein [Rhodococcus marinonascens]|uniref:hypothetical protein n=1 Tax=Rhodococcus marinonascens TaxID=38311 RepID=UPI000935400C|nr:hypothetical protein [Rhodococcus marinonascens]
MITDDDKITATMVLAKCAANDPWFPNGGEATVMAWAEVFSDARLPREDLLAGVARAYRLAKEGFRPLPGPIVEHSKAAYFESIQALPEDRREAMEEASHVLQGMGIAPPEAHRYARRVALGRTPQLQLTAEQTAEFRRRLAERRELVAEPRKAIIGTSWFKAAAR